MLDKLDLEIPFGMPMSRFFARLWYDPNWDEKFRKKRDGLYEVTADLRDAGISARLSIGHRHHKRLGPKLEILETGAKHYSDWVEIASTMFEGDVEEAGLMRIDPCADISDVSVSDFGDAFWCSRKLITRQEYGENLTSTVQRLGAQTLYYGLKPHQFRIYAKTLHRLYVLLPEINRKRKKQRLEPITFQQAFGYDPLKVITRVERQMGAREPNERWGVRSLGDIPQLAKCDPFDRLKFVTDVGCDAEFQALPPSDRMLIDFVRELIRREGIDSAKAHVRQYYAKGDSFRYWWRKYEKFFIPRPKVEPKVLTEIYRKSLTAQLAA